MSELLGPACFRSICLRLFLFGSHLLRVSHEARYFALMLSFLSLLRYTNMPLAFVVFNKLPFVYKLLKNVCRSLVFYGSSTLLDHFLLENANSSEKFPFVFLLLYLLKFELLHFSFGAPALGACFQHIDTSTVDSYT